VPFDAIVGRYVAKDIIDERTARSGSRPATSSPGTSTTATSRAARSRRCSTTGITEIPVLDIDNISVGPYIRNTMAVDKNMNRDRR
jgi:DNA-directed RNA polymerase subunit beta